MSVFVSTIAGIYLIECALQENASAHCGLSLFHSMASKYHFKCAMTGREISRRFENKILNASLGTIKPNFPFFQVELRVPQGERNATGLRETTAARLCAARRRGPPSRDALAPPETRPPLPRRLPGPAKGVFQGRCATNRRKACSFLAVGLQFRCCIVNIFRLPPLRRMEKTGFAAGGA